MSQYSQWDLGACGCPSTTVACAPCAIGASARTLSWTGPGAICTNPASGTVTLSYLGLIGGHYKWSGSTVVRTFTVGPCFNTTVTFDLVCDGAATTLTASGTVTGFGPWSCSSDIATQATSHSCGPFSAFWNATNALMNCIRSSIGSIFNTITIT